MKRKTDLEREQMPRYVFRDGMWWCCEGYLYKAWFAGVPRKWPAGKAKQKLRIVQGGLS